MNLIVHAWSLFAAQIKKIDIIIHMKPHKSAAFPRFTDVRIPLVLIDMKRETSSQYPVYVKYTHKIHFLQT